jgi:tRNA modification GTPase
MSEQPTIFALSSGRGRSGVAVIRVSGSRSGEALRQLAGDLPLPRHAVVRRLRDPENGDLLDVGLVLWFPAPQSFTGEDVVELHVHGGQATISAVVSALGRISGLLPAEAGEFTRRAFHHGKLDLTQVEGLADLIDAETEAQRKQAVRQMSGAMGTLYDSWRHELLHCLAYYEAEIDFPDEQGVPEDVALGLGDNLRTLVTAFEEHLNSAQRGERLRDGLCVVIAGAPNVGKSSLLNAIAKRDVAIVSEHAGTTRDIIELHLDLNGYPVTLVDTAGLREASDDVEREGVFRARRRIEDADLVVWVDEATASGGDVTDYKKIDSPALRVLNKSDLAPGNTGIGADNGAISVSAKTGEGLDVLISALTARAEAAFGGAATPLITRERHRMALSACRDHVNSALKVMDSGAELVAEDLRLASRHLGRITGRIEVDDLLDVIFRDFCIGK